MESSVFDSLLHERILFLNGRICSEMANEMKAKLRYLDLLNGDPITMYIDSPGGCIVSGFSIIDTMRLIRAPVHTIANGMAASMASVILVAGETAAATRESIVMIHQASMDIDTSMTVTDVKIEFDYVNLLYEKAIKLYMTKMEKTSKEIREYLTFDRFLTSREAKKLKLISKIL